MIFNQATETSFRFLYNVIDWLMFVWSCLEAPKEHASLFKLKLMYTTLARPLDGTIIYLQLTSNDTSRQAELNNVEEWALENNLLNSQLN